MDQSDMRLIKRMLQRMTGLAMIAMATFAASTVTAGTGGIDSEPTAADQGDSATPSSTSPAEPAGKGHWSFVVFPDTQYAVAMHPNLFYSMCQWVVTNKTVYNIKEAVSVGDLINDAVAAQYQTASNGCGMILAAGIPVLLAPGNHDKDALSSINPYGITNYNLYMPQSFWTNVPGGWTGGFENPTNVAGVYNVVSNNGVGYLFLGIGWVPDTNLMGWATNIFDRFPSCPAFYVTHLFVDDVSVGRRSSVNNQWSYPAANLFEDDYTPRYLFPNQQWRDYLAGTKNVVATFSGHFVSGLNQEWFIDQANDGHLVTQSFVNYQSAEYNGAEGFWELVTVSPEDNECYVQTFTLDSHTLRAVIQTNVTYEFPLRATGPPPQLSAWQQSQALSAQEQGLLLYLNFASSGRALLDRGPFALHQTYGLGRGNSPAPFSGGIQNRASTLGSTELGHSPTFASPSNYIAIGDREPFANLSNLTLSAWVKIPSPSSISPRGGTVVADYLPPNFCDFWLYVTNTGTNGLSVGFVTEDQLNHPNPHTFTAASPNLADGQWHYLAATYALGLKRLYLDGVLTATATPYHDMLFCGPGNLSIGNLATPSLNRGPTTNQFGNNYIDEVKVASQAWTPSQINVEYQRVKRLISTPSGL
jgi:hypothetical protein